MGTRRPLPSSPCSCASDDAAAAESLKDQASRLAEVVRVFRIEESVVVRAA